MATYKKLKAYYYGGFDKPKLIATSITGLLRNTKVTNTYRGDVTSEMRLEVKAYKEGQNTFEEFVEYMEDFNIFINPTKGKLIEVSKKWFGNETPFHHFKDFH